MTSDRAVAIAAALMLVGGPLLQGGLGLIRTSRAPTGADGDATTRRGWTPTILSALLYTLAFNLTFLIQELFLVLPKAFTPGLRPTLFHNNHRWDGENDLASLFQGTGVVAIFLTGAACALMLRRARGRSTAFRLWLFWMAYCGFFMALPQVVIGAVSARSDMGMAMGYLGLGPPTKLAAALAALVTIPLIALALTDPLLGLAADENAIRDAKARTQFVFRIATAPALLALPLIFAFRVPREWVEVVMVPVVVSLIGIAWIQAGAWRVTDARSTGRPIVGGIARPLGAVLLLLLVFQLLLRPGIRFY